MNTRAVACAEMCRTSAHFMLIGTEHHRHTCRECAEICRQCADDCERVGDMEICGAPRDALVADIAPPELRGASVGLRQSLDTVGAFFGPLVAIGLMWLTADHFQTVFWIAVLPAFLSVGVLLFLVREPERPQELRRVRTPFTGIVCWIHALMLGKLVSNPGMAIPGFARSGARTGIGFNDRRHEGT